MSAEVVLNITDGTSYYLSAKMVRKKGRSFWHTSRHFRIQGGQAAVNGWAEFSESFNVDDIESARYVAWYYMLLCKLYIQGCTVEDMYALANVDHSKYLTACFANATYYPNNPALVLAHHCLRAILGAHLDISSGELKWQLEPRYRELFGRIVAILLGITISYVPDSMLCIGWVWREPHRWWTRSRAWFFESYNPSNNTIGSCWFTTPMSGTGWELAVLYDTNIFVPDNTRQVWSNSFTPGAWRPRKKIRRGKNTVATWFD